jgi:hypothetical protein
MKRRGLRARLLIALTGLFPVWWQQRYRDEFTDMLRALLTSGRRNTLSLALDIVVGAVDAHLLAGPANRAPAFPVVRRAAYEGLAVATLLAAGNVLTNVVFPTAAADDGAGPWAAIGIVVVYLGVFGLMTAIGARGTQRSTTRHAGIKAGATAGLVIATMFILTWFAIDNLFFDTISRQPEKVLAFATSGQSSMRAFINLNLLRGVGFFIPELTVVGALLGWLGGRLVRRTPDHSPFLTES